MYNLPSLTNIQVGRTALIARGYNPDKAPLRGVVGLENLGGFRKLKKEKHNIQAGRTYRPDRLGL